MDRIRVMMRDPMWQSFGVIVSIILAIGLFILQSQRKEIEYQILSSAPVINFNDSMKGRLQILLDGKPAQDVYLILVKISNSGNAPVVSSDYDRPLRLNFGKNTKILSAQIIDTTPKNLAPSFIIEEISATDGLTKEMQIRFKEQLLNGGDSFTVQAFVNQYDNEISIDGRIVGITSIKMVTGQVSFSEAVNVLIPIFAIIVVLLVIASFLGKVSRGSVIIILIGVILFIAIAEVMQLIRIPLFK